ncbi:MAG: hypothetical protein KU37_08105 [Sulfuricurvum sp. PC08-66]|nr:MAG: hypothetical protein KU37_08105 [Sulfuricurvum sp. PC08-66]
MNSLGFAPEKILKTYKWYTQAEIEMFLEGVSHIIMVEPDLRDNKSKRLHFTLFLNTREALPPVVIEPVTEKFFDELGLYDVIEMSHFMAEVAFAQTSQETPMPHLLDEAATASYDGAQSVPCFVLDFYALAREGYEEIAEGLSGWSYVRN